MKDEILLWVVLSIVTTSVLMYHGKIEKLENTMKASTLRRDSIVEHQNREIDSLKTIIESWEDE